MLISLFIKFKGLPRNDVVGPGHTSAGIRDESYGSPPLHTKVQPQKGNGAYPVAHVQHEPMLPGQVQLDPLGRPMICRHRSTAILAT